jgi:hypothetical protein
MSTYPPLTTQMGILRQEISDLSLLQERHEHWSHQTHNQRLHEAHLRVASELEQTLFVLDKLRIALELIENQEKE